MDALRGFIRANRSPETPAPSSGASLAPLGVRLANLIVVIVPFLGLLAAVALLWGRVFSWTELALLLGMYFLTGLGITVGFHRLFAHRSFETSRPVTFLLGVLGSMAVQGSLLNWVALHRRHHQYSDRDGDPHSPHHYQRGMLGLLRGLWHAHVGWLFRPEPSDLARYVKDLQQSRLLRVVSALFPLWVIAGMTIPAGIGGLVSGSWGGAALGFIWGGLVRIFLVHHVTWSVNSICHLWGSRPYPTPDESRDNIIVGVLALGEGWHNSHHAFPSSARHGLRWWKLDLSYCVIWILALVGLAWNVKLPAREVESPPAICDLS